MAQSQPEERITLDQIFNLVEQLSHEERMKLRAKLDSRTWAERWDCLVKKVRQQSKDLPPISDDEIVEQMKEIRRES